MEEKAPTMDSKFRRVLVAASRAEQLMRGARPKIEANNRKPPREAVAALLTRSRSEDKKALAEHVELVMEEVGL